jgi:tryptophan-rich sensory protein
LTEFKVVFSLSSFDYFCTNKTKMNKLTKILAVVVTCLAIGYFSGTVTRSAIIDWYPTLVKPVLIPELDFAPVWKRCTL